MGMIGAIAEKIIFPYTLRKAQRMTHPVRVSIIDGIFTGALLTGIFSGDPAVSSSILTVLKVFSVGAAAGSFISGTSALIGKDRTSSKLKKLVYRGEETISFDMKSFSKTGMVHSVPKDCLQSVVPQLKKINEAIKTRVKEMVSKRGEELAAALPQNITDLFSGSYEGIKKIGSGAMADIYYAKEKDGEKREVVIKYFNPKDVDDQSVIEELKKRFIEREQKILQKLEDFGAAPKLYKQSDDEEYFICEYIPGVTLEDIYQKSTDISLPEILLIMIKVYSALKTIHLKDIIHRDIKMDNLMLDQEGNLIFIDFGMSKDVKANPKITLTGQLLGNYESWHPDHESGDPKKLEIFSAAVTVLYRMLFRKSARSNGFNRISQLPKRVEILLELKKKGKKLIEGESIFEGQSRQFNTILRLLLYGLTRRDNRKIPDNYDLIVSAFLRQIEYFDPANFKGLKIEEPIAPNESKKTPADSPNAKKDEEDTRFPSIDDHREIINNALRSHQVTIVENYISGQRKEKGEAWIKEQIVPFLIWKAYNLLPKAYNCAVELIRMLDKMPEKGESEMQELKRAAGLDHVASTDGTTLAHPQGPPPLPVKAQLQPKEEVVLLDELLKDDAWKSGQPLERNFNWAVYYLSEGVELSKSQALEKHLFLVLKKYVESVPGRVFSKNVIDMLYKVSTTLISSESGEIKDIARKALVRLGKVSS